MSRAQRLGLIGLLIAAAAVRVAFGVTFLRAPVGAIVPLDTEPYRALAQAIATGQLGHPAFDYLNPPYAFLIAPFASLPPETGRAFTTGLQIVMDVAVVALVYFVARRLFGHELVALGASALYAFYGTAIFYTTLELPVTTSVLAFIGALAALLQAANRRPPFWLLAGLAWGVFLMARPNAVVLLPVVALWMRGKPGKAAAFLMTGMALVLVPFSLRSLAQGTGPSPFPVNGGINFYIGNSEIAHGRYAHVPNVTDKPGQQVQTSIAEASRRAGQPLDARGASSFWFRAGLAWMAHEPAAALQLTLKKAGTFFRGEEVPLNISYDFAREHMPLLRACVGLGLILPLALWGMGVALLRGRGSDVGLLLGTSWAYAASVIAFFISDRYRMPVVPLLAIFAAYGAAELVAAVRSRTPARIAVAVGALAVAAIFANYPFTFFRYAPDGVDHVKLSDVYVNRGEYDKALEECTQAAALSPEMPDTLFCFATAHYFRQSPFQAEMSLRAAMDAQVGTFSDVPARRNLAHVLKEQKLFQEALTFADEDQKATIETEREAWKRDAGDLAAYARGQRDEASRQKERGQLFEARYSLRRAIEADPTLAEAHFLLAAVSGELRLDSEACAAARQAAARQPSEPRYRAAVDGHCR